MNNTNMLKNNVANIMIASPITVAAQDSMQKVSSVLQECHLSSVPVIDPEKHECFGIISLRDIVSLNARKANLHTLQAWEACTYKPISVPPETPIEEVAHLMVKHRIHHILIAENQKLLGFVSTLDIIAACLDSCIC